MRVFVPTTDQTKITAIFEQQSKQTALYCYYMRWRVGYIVCDQRLDDDGYVFLSNPLDFSM